MMMYGLQLAIPPGLAHTCHSDLSTQLDPEILTRPKSYHIESLRVSESI